MRSQTRQSYAERTLRVLQHIQKRLDDPLSLGELARVSGFSEYHFHRIFKGVVGESVKEHIRRLRIERAAFRLMHTDQPITTIAFDAGYETHEAFTRYFRKVFNSSPSQFRQLHRRAWHAGSSSGVHFVPSGELSTADLIGVSDDSIKIRITSIPNQRVAFMRHVGPYLDAGGTWNELLGWAKQNGIDRTLQRSGICYDDPAITHSDRLRYDACLKLDQAIDTSGTAAVQDLFGGEFAVFTHTGPYEQLAGIHEMLLGQWLPSSGREVRDAPCIEVYRRSAFDTDVPDELQTEVCVPLVPSS